MIVCDVCEKVIYHDGYYEITPKKNPITGVGSGGFKWIALRTDDWREKNKKEEASALNKDVTSHVCNRCFNDANNVLMRLKYSKKQKENYVLHPLYPAVLK